MVAGTFAIVFCFSITVPHTEQWLPSVFPSANTVGATAASFTTVWPFTGIDTVCTASQEAQFSTLLPAAVHVAFFITFLVIQLWLCTLSVASKSYLFSSNCTQFSEPGFLPKALKTIHVEFLVFRVMVGTSQPSVYCTLQSFSSYTVSIFNVSGSPTPVNFPPT